MRPLAVVKPVLSVGVRHPVSVCREIGSCTGHIWTVSAGDKPGPIRVRVSIHKLIIFANLQQ